MHLRNQPKVCRTDTVNESAQACKKMDNNVDKNSCIARNNCDFVITAKKHLSFFDLKGIEEEDEEFCAIRMP